MNIVTVKTDTGYSTYDADDVSKEKVVPKCSSGEHEWKKKSFKRQDMSTTLSGKSVTGQVVYEQCIKCKETKNAEVVMGLTCLELRQLA